MNYGIEFGVYRYSLFITPDNFSPSVSSIHFSNVPTQNEVSPACTGSLRRIVDTVLLLGMTTVQLLRAQFDGGSVV